MRTERLPHEGCRTRLGVSKIHGVGVFAIQDIPEGTDIFQNDQGGVVWIDAARLEGLDAETRRLYDDFCIIKDGRYGCPEDFTALTPSWYLNQAAPGVPANVRMNERFEAVAARDIKAGEELTSDYDTYSEW